jgi:hypothetical protein
MWYTRRKASHYTLYYPENRQGKGIKTSKKGQSDKEEAPETSRPLTRDPIRVRKLA